MELEIYDRQGTLKKKVSPDSSSRWTEEVGAEFVVTVNFTTWEFFVLSVGDYVEISGKRFSIKKEYRPKKTDTQKYTYNISFYGREHDMQDLLFCRLNQGEDDLESVFAYDGTPMEMLEKLVANMNRNTDGVTWRAGQAVTGDRKTINFNGLFCWDAAGEIAGAWETEWWLDGEYLNIGKCEHGERVTLGYMKGLKTGLTQNENSNSIKWFTRLIPVGSTKNIDPSKYGYTHLQLPSRDKYIDLNTQLGLKEHREEAAFQDIFPHRLGTVSSVRSEEQTNTDGEKYTVYYVKDKDLPMNPDEYMIGGEVIHITFESGDLSGREFECNWHNDTQEFEIINTYPDENTQIPGGNIIPDTGDTYILTNIRMPDEYYPIAEEQYKQAVDSFLTEYSKDISIYSGDTDYIHVDKHSVPLSLGQRVRLEDAQYFETGYLDTRITRIERKLDNLSEASIDCSSAVSTSWKSSVDSTLNNLEYTLAQEMAQANVRLLKTGDMESPSDYTAFSSLRAIGTFLRKNIADIASEIITFLKGLRVGKFVTGLVGGSGAAIWIDKNGKTVVEADKAIYREELIVPQITFNCIDVISGDKANSFAYGRIKTVDTENRIATLELLEGQWGTLHVSDICRGILHNIAGSNHTQDEYGPNGFMEYSGYATSYFTPTRIIENEAGNMKFEYALQAGTSVHPLPGMNFFAYGNFTDKDRQAITYENRYYLRRLVNVNTWVIDPDVNIVYQNGNLNGLIVNGQVMGGYSSFQDKVYIRGTIERLKPNGEVAMDLSYEGVWESGEHYDYYDSVTHNGSTWACLKKNGSSSEPGTDADWQEIASKGDKGDGYTQMGQFKTGMVVPKMGVVSMGGGSYVAKTSTTNPPLWCWTDNAGNRFTFNDGGYVLTGEVNTAEYDVLAEPGRDGTNGINGTDGVPGAPGKDGKTYYTWIRYADDAQGNGISNDPTGKAYIGLAYNKETAVESDNPSDYKWSDIKGEPGVPGAVGADGKTYYTWIAYSDNADGSGMYQQPNNNTKYIGIAVNKETATESSNPADYTWSQFKGNKGDKGDGYTQMGQFRTGMVVPKMGVVSMGGGSYVAKISTTNPPLWCWTDNNGNRFTFNDGGYVLTGEVNTAEYDVWAEKGDTGAKGDKGDKGDDGEKGDKGDQGVQGIQGCIFRESEWSASSVQYRNDEALTSGTRYVDFALIRNDAAIDGWDVYKCLKTHVSSDSNKPGNTTYWEKLSGVGPIYTSLIIAKNASLDFVQGNELLIKDANNNVVAGLTGGSSKEAGTTPIRIWAGGKVPGTAPFRVDQNGNLVATKADIIGTITADSGRIGPFSIVSGILSSKAIYDSSTNSYAGFKLSAGQIEFYNEKTEASLKFGGTTKYVTWEGVTYEAGIDIQSPNVLLGMHVNTPSLPLVVEGGNIILHPNISSYVSIRGITLNARAVSVNTKLNSNDDIISFTNTSDITVTMPDANAGKVLFIKKYNTAKVTLTGGTFMNANDGGTSTTFVPAQHSHMFVKDIRGRWIDFYCG
ncbi:hypothetical protein [Phocaeicola sartorii]|uniref:hypothetical protein n=1 Tax=Phocaeicola sartorii TaxID=671267 RepID=UPI00248BD6C8|nr:hypothetical protein [Phocaeicola sartorii]